MKTLLVIPMALLLALSVVPAWAKSDNGNGNGQVKGAPGPLVGAGLPVLLVGGGIYWIVRRRKRRARSSNDR
jgi:LPXTG-motif cell wall-anchored protein